MNSTNTMNSNSPRYIMLVKAACMPSSCWGQYVRVGVVELEAGFEGEPKMLSSRSRGVKRVVQTWEKCRVGRTERAADSRAIAEAQALIAQLQGDHNGTYKAHTQPEAL